MNQLLIDDGKNKQSVTINSLKFVSINSIRCKVLELIYFLDFHETHVGAVWEIKVIEPFPLLNFSHNLVHIIFTGRIGTTMVAVCHF